MVDKPITIKTLHDLTVTAPSALSDVDSYEIYVRITPIRYHDMLGDDAKSIERAEKRGMSYGAIGYVARVESKEAGALFAVAREILYLLLHGY